MMIAKRRRTDAREMEGQVGKKKRFSSIKENKTKPLAARDAKTTLRIRVTGGKGELECLESLPLCSPERSRQTELYDCSGRINEEDRWLEVIINGGVRWLVLEATGIS